MMAKLLLAGLACGLALRGGECVRSHRSVAVRVISMSMSSISTQNGLLSKSNNHHKLPRIFVPSSAISIDRELVLDSKTSHYLSNVMRIRDGERVRIFNNILLKEFLCEVISINKSNRNNVAVVLRPLEVLKDNSSKSTTNSIISYIAPIKRQKMKVLLEKMTECGVSRIVQVITQNTQANNIMKTISTDNNNNDDDDNNNSDNNISRMIIESCEQCERLDIPILDFSSLKLSSLLSRFAEEKSDSGNNNVLFVCRERIAGGSPFWAALEGYIAPQSTRDIHFLIGPEGGFTREEYDLIDSRYSHVVKYVSLSSENVLRAETAAIAAVGIAQQFLDYRRM